MTFLVLTSLMECALLAFIAAAYKLCVDERRSHKVDAPDDKALRQHNAGILAQTKGLKYMLGGDFADLVAMTKYYIQSFSKILFLILTHASTFCS